METIATNYNADAEEDDGSCTYSIVGGSWLTTSVQEVGSITATMMGLTVFDSSWTNIQTDSLEPYKLKFNNGGTAHSYLADGSIEETINWAQSGNQLTITDSDTSFTLTVVSVNRSNATFAMYMSGTEDDDGVIMTYNMQQTLNFTRDMNTFHTNNTSLRTSQTNWLKEGDLLRNVKTKIKNNK